MSSPHIPAITLSSQPTSLTRSASPMQPRISLANTYEASLPTFHPHELVSNDGCIDIRGKTIKLNGAPYYHELSSGKTSLAPLTVNNFYGQPVYLPDPIVPYSDINLDNIPQMLAAARTSKMAPIRAELDLPQQLHDQLVALDKLANTVDPNETIEDRTQRNKAIEKKRATLFKEVISHIGKSLGFGGNLIGNGPVVLQCEDSPHASLPQSWVIRADAGGDESGIWRAIDSKRNRSGSVASVLQPIIGSNLHEALAYYLMDQRVTKLKLLYNVPVQKPSGPLLNMPSGIIRE